MDFNEIVDRVLTGYCCVWPRGAADSIPVWIRLEPTAPVELDAQDGIAEPVEASAIDDPHLRKWRWSPTGFQGHPQIPSGSHMCHSIPL